MKAILLAGAALMIGASIYGVVDYQHTRQKKEFKNMYAEEPATVTEEKNISADPVKTAVLKEEKSVAAGNTEVKKNTTVVKKKTVKKKRKFSTRLFSRGALDERYIEPLPPAEIKTDTGKTTEKEQ